MGDVTSRTELVSRARELDAAREPFVWATVVRAERPTSAKPGDAALILADGRIEGFVGGACAESTVRAQALDVLERGSSRLVRITPQDESAAPVDGRPGEVTVVNPCLSGGTLEIFLDPAVPPPLVVVVGDGPIARALEQVGIHVGRQVVRVAHDDAPDLPDDTAAVVVASHGRSEEAALTRALEAGVGYVGLVASRRRGTAVVEGLPVTAEQRARVHTPAGLDIGARTPGEVALSILAEIVAERPRPERDAPAPSAVTGATTARDPVCGMTVAAVEATVHADIDGTRVWFCGPGCRDAYLDAPARYRS